MNLKELIAKISKEDPYWTSKIQLSFGDVLVNKIFLSCHGCGEENYMNLDDYFDMISEKQFNLEMLDEEFLDEVDECS